MIKPTQTVIDNLVNACLAEDIGDGDLTAALVPETAMASARLICRESAVLCGQQWFETVFRKVDPAIQLEWYVGEGERMQEDSLVCEIKGPARTVLTGERAAINLLQTLSGTATTANEYARRLDGLKTQVLDTRKTIPALRVAQKYAAAVGGAANHRVGLYDGVLIKENHIEAAGSITAAVKSALASTPSGTLLEVEVESLEGLREAIDAGAKRILLDNFSIDELKQAVLENKGRAELEASGNVTLETLRSIAETGVDYISVGAITKHLRAVDFSLRFSQTIAG